MSDIAMKNSLLEYLKKKHISCTKPDSCVGCEAFTAFTQEQIYAGFGAARRSMSFEELRYNHLLGGCDLGFDQNWKDWGIAEPLEECPKPETEADFLRCVSFFN